MRCSYFYPLKGLQFRGIALLRRKFMACIGSRRAIRDTCIIICGAAHFIKSNAIANKYIRLEINDVSAKPASYFKL
jgi:hypothetical protein